MLSVELSASPWSPHLLCESFKIPVHPDLKSPFFSSPQGEELSVPQSHIGYFLGDERLSYFFQYIAGNKATLTSLNSPLSPSFPLFKMSKLGLFFQRLPRHPPPLLTSPRPPL